jgi:HAD superfamily hydrolase (TIGR01549 family)
MVRGVLFDLDDTLFDHHGCARAALRRVHGAVPSFSCNPFDDLEAGHAAVLEELHAQVVAGALPLDQARTERFRRLLEAAGAAADPESAARAAQIYRQGYLDSRRAVAGAAALLQAVKTRARVAIVSNNVLDEQVEKLRECALDAFVDVLVVSEEAGVPKPDPAIFELALSRIGCRARETVMIGDSWAADVVGAEGAGIRAIWFNPRGLPRRDGRPHVPELRALEPVSAVLDLVFGPSASGRDPRAERA